jgi:iron-sulfur cluster assembly protein
MAELTVVRNGQESAGLALAEGKPLLEGLLQHGVELAHECGGALACATCCVVVRRGMESLSPASEDEEDMLERANVRAPGARLSCQAIVGCGALVIEIAAARTAFPPPAAVLPGSFSVSVTERAARHFLSQLAKHPGAAAVRLSVEAAGCSGLSYRVDPASAIRDNDAVFESRGIRIAVDPASLPHVRGTTIDIAEAGLVRRLRFDNPNVTRTCGCGESFAT